MILVKSKGNDKIYLIERDYILHGIKYNSLKEIGNKKRTYELKEISVKKLFKEHKVGFFKRIYFFIKLYT